VETVTEAIDTIKVFGEFSVVCPRPECVPAAEDNIHFEAEVATWTGQEGP